MPGQRCCTCNTSQQQPDTLLHKSRLQELGASIEFDGEMSVLMLMLEEEVTNNRATSTSFTVSLSRQTILAMHPHVVDCMRDDALHCTILHGLRWVGERYYGRSAKDLVGGGPLPMTVLDLYLPSLAKPPLAPDVDQDFYNAIACAVSCVLAMVQPTECLALSLSHSHLFDRSNRSSFLSGLLKHRCLASGSCRSSCCCASSSSRSGSLLFPWTFIQLAWCWVGHYRLVARWTELDWIGLRCALIDDGQE
jgi:hypothetical protein